MKTHLNIEFVETGIEYDKDTFLEPKVKVEFQHFFSVHPFFHFENGLVFGLPIKLMQISMFFCWLTGLHWNNTRF
jgi:hypothetical protein